MRQKFLEMCNVITDKMRKYRWNKLDIVKNDAYYYECKRFDM